jgi:hypothetical protein
MGFLSVDLSITRADNSSHLAGFASQLPRWLAKWMLKSKSCLVTNQREFQINRVPAYQAMLWFESHIPSGTRLTSR